MNTKQIAAQILIDWENCNYEHIPGAAIYKFNIDGMTIRCRDNLESVQAISEKFRKARNHPNPIPAASRIVRRFSITTFRDFASTGERDNAIQYANLFDKVPVEVQTLVRSWAQ